MNLLQDFKPIVEQLYDGVYVVDPDRTILFWNESAERITGFRKDEVIGSHCFDNILNHCNECGYSLCVSKCPLDATLRDGKNREAHVFLKHKKGHRVPVHVRITPLRNPFGKIVGAVEIFNDNTKVRSVTDQLKEFKQAALMDTLTELPNRRYLSCHLEKVILSYTQNQMSAGLLFIDVDRFKQINDGLGHDAGDHVLRLIAQTISACARPYDVVGRWGGDEFLAVLQGVDATRLQQVGERYRYLVEQSDFRWDEQPLDVSISCGGAMLEPGMNDEAWIRSADRGLYQSKANGRNSVTVHDSRTESPLPLAE